MAIYIYITMYQFRMCELFVLLSCIFLATGKVIVDTSSERVHPKDDEPYTQNDAAENLLERSHVGELLSSLAKPQNDAVCTNDADIGFILDSSGSIWEHYDKEKFFLNSLVESFGLGSTKSRASVITFSYYSVLSIKFNDFFDINVFKTAVNKIPLMRSVTLMDKALRLAQREMFKTANGARPDKPKVLVLLTDGEQTTKYQVEDPAPVVKELRAQGVNVLVVGMGRYVKESSLIKIAGSADKAFRVTQFKDLISPAFIGQMKTETCKAVQEAIQLLPTKAPAPCPESNVDYKGGDIKLILNITTWQDCAKNCRALSSCEVFTFVKKSGCCYLKNAKATKTTSTGLTSGSKTCKA